MITNVFALTSEDLKKVPADVKKTSGNLITFVDNDGDEFTVLRHTHNGEYVYIVL